MEENIQIIFYLKFEHFVIRVQPIFVHLEYFAMHLTLKLYHTNYSARFI